MKRLLLTALIAVLALAAPASAKQVSTAKVCGADGCQNIDSPSEQLLMGGPPTSGPSDPGPFVRFHYTMAYHGGRETASNIFVPSVGLVLADDGRTWMRPSALGLLQQLAARVTMFPASRFPTDALEPKPVAHQPVASGGGSNWWLWLLASPILLALGVAFARRRGTNDRRKVYGLAGAWHGRRPGGAREAR